MAEFVWKRITNRHGKVTYRCFNTLRRHFAKWEKCPQPAPTEAGPPPVRKKPKRKRGKIGAAPSRRFGWRKVCWNNDTEEVVADAKCERRPVKRHRFCLQPSGECWDREAEKNVAPNMCGNPHARRAGWVARPCGS